MKKVKNYINIISTICSVYIVIFLISCSSNNITRKPINNFEENTIYIEDFSGDKFNIKQRLEFELSRIGLNPILEKEKSDYILRWQYTYASFGTNASVRLINKNGETVYLGEGKNPGFGTWISKTGATWGCFKRALEDLEKNNMHIRSSG